MSVALGVMLFGACGDDSADDAGTVAITSTVAEASAPLPAPPSTTESAAGTSTTAYTVSPTSPETTAPPSGPTVINATLGVDSSPDRREVVALGSDVVIVITNPTSADEFHIHGYDLGDGVEVPAGESTSFSFTATMAGEFEVESHETDDVIFTLVVE